MKFTFGTKIIVAAVAVFLVYVIGTRFNLLPSAIKQNAAVPTQFSLPTEAPDAPITSTSVALVLPSTTLAARKGPLVKIETIPWNAIMGLALANGGSMTTKNSVMEKHGVSVQITMVKDTNVSQQNQVKFATAVAAGADTPSDGTAFVIIMGDSSAQYMASINKLLTKLGSDYYVENVGHVGYSRGEDGWWGPSSWMDNKEAMRGGVTAAVLRDGDWNVAQYKLANDGIKNNPDEKTWDADAMNWIAADDFEKAVEMYVAGYCEDRPIVKDGKLTSEKHHTCVEGVATWTPADVTLAKQKGGLVRLLSTKENAFQMPATLIGIHAWNVKHTKIVADLLESAFQGGDMVKQHEAQALPRAAQASYAIYAEQTPSYWAKYYKGVTERDKTGQPVPLGGSTVANLADNLVFYGLSSGAGGLDSSLWRATYEGFGNIAKQQYPKLVPDFPRYSQAFNATFLRALAERGGEETPADLPTFTDSAIAKSDIVARRDYTINFDTGKATFTPEAEATLSELYTRLLQGGGLAVEITGHTDNVGNPQINSMLSQARAKAVQSWLETKAPTLFPTGRVQALGLGDQQPVASNATADGRAKNRRVTIVLGTK